jgi:alpha-ribazole phosphatase
LAPAYSTDDRLAELDFGDWEGRRWDEIDRTDFDRWADDYVSQPAPGGQSWLDLSQKAAAFLTDLRSQPYENVIVVSHAGVIRALLALVLDIALVSTWRIEVPFASITLVQIGTDSRQDRLLSLSAKHLQALT